VVLTLVNKRMIREQDFDLAARRILPEPARHAHFLPPVHSPLEYADLSPTRQAPDQLPEVLEVQARQLRKMVEGSAPAYLPFLPSELSRGGFFMPTNNLWWSCTIFSKDRRRTRLHKRLKDFGSRCSSCVRVLAG
jgi:hypothetical protein